MSTNRKRLCPGCDKWVSAREIECKACGADTYLATPEPPRRPVVVYAETYRAPGLKLKAHCLPTLPSAEAFVVFEAYVLKAGRLERDGKTFEFQDVRVYLRENVDILR